MAFVDTTPREIVGVNEPEVELTLDALPRIGVVGLIHKGDPLGIDATNGWALAEGATPVAPKYIAGMSARENQRIKVFRAAHIFAEFNAVAGEFGDTVYLSDTGTYVLTAGTNCYKVGQVIAEDEIFVDMRAVAVYDAQDIPNAIVDSGHITAGSIDLEHMASLSVDSPQIVDGSIDEANVAAFLAAGGLGMLRVAMGYYDFTSPQGGAVGDIGLDATIPDNAIVIGGGVDAIATPTSAGAATMALMLEAADDIVLACAFDGGAWLQANQHDVIPAGIGTGQVKTTAAREITLRVGAFDLTAGEFFCWLLYLVTG